jgi:hypothetical protein
MYNSLTREKQMPRNKCPAEQSPKMQLSDISFPAGMTANIQLSSLVPSPGSFGKESGYSCRTYLQMRQKSAGAAAFPENHMLRHFPRSAAGLMSQLPAPFPVKTPKGCRSGYTVPDRHP